MNSLYKTGGIAAVLAALIFRRWLAAEFLLLVQMGIVQLDSARLPSTVFDWFSFLPTHPLAGLTLLNVFDLVNYGLVGLIYLGLYDALKNTHPGLMSLAASMGFVAIAVYFSSHPSFSMLALSQQYSAATGDAQRSILLAAGQAVLASHNQGSGFYLSFFLINLAGLLFGLAMHSSGLFNRWTAWMGILANGLGIGYFLLRPFSNTLVAIPLALSAPFLMVWYLLIAHKLFTFCRTEKGILAYPQKKPYLI